VDATIIAAPSSTKNATKSRDPEMKQTKKGKNWHFGMKFHVGTDRAAWCNLLEHRLGQLVLEQVSEVEDRSLVRDPGWLFSAKTSTRHDDH